MPALPRWRPETAVDHFERVGRLGVGAGVGRCAGSSSRNTHEPGQAPPTAQIVHVDILAGEHQ